MMAQYRIKIQITERYSCYLSRSIRFHEKRILFKLNTDIQ